MVKIRVRIIHGRALHVYTGKYGNGKNSLLNKSDLSKNYPLISLRRNKTCKLERFNSQFVIYGAVAALKAFNIVTLLFFNVPLFLVS